MAYFEDVFLKRHSSISFCGFILQPPRNFFAKEKRGEGTVGASQRWNLCVLHTEYTEATGT